MTNHDDITLAVPLALQLLIRSNNQLLRDYQKQLLQEIEDANTQLMQILRIDPALGWKLDIEQMVYTRPKTEEEQHSAE